MNISEMERESRDAKYDEKYIDLICWDEVPSLVIKYIEVWGGLIGGARQ